MTTNRLAVVVAALVLIAAGFAGGAAYGSRQAASPEAAHSRDMMFEVLDLPTKNQGGQILNLYFHYRYNPGLADKDLPDYEDLRKSALAYLASTDLSKNPYWETLNQQLCQRLKAGYPIQAISCEMQVHSHDIPGTWYEPGYHASIDTIGDIPALTFAGPGDPPQAPTTVSTVHP